MKIRIIKNNPLENEETIEQYVGNVYEVVTEKFIDGTDDEGVLPNGAVFVKLEEMNNYVSIVYKDEYEIFEK